ncbi:hypothetical protein KHQ84_gp134 [Rhodococcus phage Finch]|uniref:Uncharacterized protein n=1 Tax=Rhodococcus phage Finch TaxID=2094144 RepID=A0A2P1JXN5_9CAUD|nr:hypothetical protein KHQ84_gp134 [Rhodococcus phage Finch]AVO25064.1 hypothetical protein SEA_FINCH_134 [Rhodococcus phage Finch]
MIEDTHLQTPTAIAAHNKVAEILEATKDVVLPTGLRDDDNPNPELGSNPEAFDLGDGTSINIYEDGIIEGFGGGQFSIEELEGYLIGSISALRYLHREMEKNQ